MRMITNLVGGLTGAVALTLLHETVKRYDHDAPRVDLVGEDAIVKLMEGMGAEPPKGDSLYMVTLAGDVLSNALYYSLIGWGNKQHLLRRGFEYGLTAGIGALTLTKPLGLSDAPVTKTDKTKALTIAWYVFGGVITALTIKAFRK